MELKTRFEQYLTKQKEVNAGYDSYEHMSEQEIATFNLLCDDVSDIIHGIETDFIELVGADYRRNQAALLATWWAGHLRKDHAPSRDTGMRIETPTDAMAFLLIRAQSKTPVIDGGTIAKFESHLAALLEESIEKSLATTHEYHNRSSYHVPVGVDYGPDRMLIMAAEDADWVHTSFPWKTITVITPLGVIAREGYGGKKVELQSWVDYFDGSG